MLINEVYPLIKKKLPNSVLRIIGQHIPKDVLSLATDSIKMFPLEEDDFSGLAQAFHDGDIFASTIKGPGGTRLKNLAAMASQLPIVSTKVGIQGLGVKDGVHALIGNTPQELADNIVKLIKNPKLAKKISLNARHHVEENYNYPAISEILNSIYQKLGKKQQ